MTAAATFLEDLDELERRLTKPHHVLVVANETCDNPSLCAVIFAHVGRRADVLVVTPALPSLASRWTSDDDSAVRRATDRMRTTVKCLQRLGMSAHGQVGDHDPVLAVEDALRDFPADEIIVFTWPEERSNWRRQNVAQRVRSRFNKRVTQVAVKDGARPVKRDSLVG